MNTIGQLPKIISVSATSPNKRAILCFETKIHCNGSMNTRTQACCIRKHTYG